MAPCPRQLDRGPRWSAGLPPPHGDQQEGARARRMLLSASRIQGLEGHGKGAVQPRMEHLTSRSWQLHMKAARHNWNHHWNQSSSQRVQQAPAKQHACHAPGLCAPGSSGCRSRSRRRRRIKSRSRSVVVVVVVVVVGCTRAPGLCAPGCLRNSRSRSRSRSSVYTYKRARSRSKRGIAVGVGVVCTRA